MRKIIFALLIMPFALYTQSIDIKIINGKPDPIFRAPVYQVDESLGDVILQNVPSYNWSYGCSSTASAMLVGYYDWHYYRNMYTGPTGPGNGFAPITNEYAWWAPDHCPLSATEQNWDGLVTRGHVDDYYLEYGNPGPDPYITNNWTEHFYGQCVGDYMGTNQSYWSNSDGSTTFIFYTNGSQTHDYTGHENASPPLKDGCHGLKEFVVNKGYSVIQNYNQYIYGYNSNNQGFTFDDYKSEIQDDRPVLIHVDNHTMLGIGYNNNGNIVILLDTWDWSRHTMPWGGYYPSGSGNLHHYGVTVFEMFESPDGINDWVDIGSGNDVLGLGDYFYYDATFYSYEGNSYPQTWEWEMILLHEGGEHLVDSKTLDQPFISSSFSGFIPSSLPSLQWERNVNGSIKGLVKVYVYDSDGYYHSDEMIFEFLLGPKNPFLLGARYHNGDIALSYYSPGTETYSIFYDIDQGHPYSGSGAIQGNSPISANGLTTYSISGLQSCTPYFFAVKGENNEGISDYSNEEKINLVTATNGLPVNYYFNEIYIYGQQTYTENYYFQGSLIISAGGTLTISGGTLYFEENSKILIEEGGQLILDGATCTAPCGQMWQGIQIQGNSSAHQWPDANGNYQQGRLVLNNATIENAIVAVDLWKDGDYSKTGGIVHATNSNFINNVRAVHALQYRNFHPVNYDEMAYNASFTNCTFEINADYPGHETFFKHVDLSQVNGLRFNGCDFSLSPDAQNVSDYNQAIAAYSAGFRVDAPCNDNYQPCSSYDHSTFNDFRVGIYAAAMNSPYTYYINRAQFNGNTIGVLSNNVNNAIILNSEFHAAKNQYNWELCTYGIFMQAANGFTIEDNQFFKQQGALLSNYIGIGVFDCNAIADVYRNEFTGLTAGNYAYGKNWDRWLYEGVEYLCNTNTSNWADFYVTGNPEMLTNGIQSKQGALTLPARNSFSTSGATWHFYNETQNLIGYYYCQNCPDQYPDYVLNVTREPVSITGSCPSHYGSDTPERSVVMDATELFEAETAFAQSNYDYQGVKTLYNNLKDGGSTEEAIFDVSTAQPSQMWEIRSKLLGDSPYLSTEVLKLAADRTDMFSEAAIFDIMAANPDELKKEELMKYLEEKENPLPDYMLNILKQVAEGTSYRTVLELQMSRHSHDRAQAANDIIRSILHADELDMNQLQLWLTNLGGLEAEKQLIATYAHQGDYSTALALAETLPAAYGLQDEQLLDHNQYMSMLQLQQNLKNSGRTMTQLTTAEQQQLTEIAESETASSSAMAKSVLELFYGAGFERCLPIAGEASYKSSTAADMNRLAQHYGMSISAKPNPAGDWAAFDYTLPEGTETALLEITDAAGKTIATYTLQGRMGQKLTDTREWSAGQYVYTLKAAGFTQSGKLVVK